MRFATPQGQRLVTKGAVETVLGFCERMRTSQGEYPLDAERITQVAMQKAGEGYRVLALAAKDLADPGSPTLTEADLRGMVFEGLLCFIDPLRPEAKEAVETAHRAGVKVVMITGDHPATALAIARELGIAENPEDVITGKDLETIGTPEVPEFYEAIRHKTVFARVTPEQKLQIVDGFIRLGASSSPSPAMASTTPRRSRKSQHRRSHGVRRRYRQRHRDHHRHRRQLCLLSWPGLKKGVTLMLMCAR